MQSIDMEKYHRSVANKKISYATETHFNELIDTEKREIHYKFQDQISKIEDKQRKEDNRLDDKKDELAQQWNEKRAELDKDIKPIDRIIWLIGRPRNVKFNVKSVQSRHERKEVDLIETYESQTTTLGLFVTVNDRKTNCYNVAVIGHSTLVDHDSYEFGLSTNQLKGWTIDNYKGDCYNMENINDNINHDVKFFSSVTEARNHAKKGLEKLFPMLTEIKTLDSEYDQVLKKYTVKDFEDIIIKKLVHKSSHVSGSTIEKAEWGLKHYFPQYEIKMSKTDLSRLIEAYQEEENKN